ncbi:hypothetical protein EV126DRAFT_464672 [Verticillium dahliae]|nr:hypothetical protein EV126DRAFT_464672 [Verticillium dahliae]
MAPEAPRRQQPKTRRTANAYESPIPNRVVLVVTEDELVDASRVGKARSSVRGRLLQELRQQARGHRGSPSPDHYEAGGRAQPRGSPRRARQLNESQTWKERQRSAPRGHEAGYQLDRGWKRDRKSLTSESCSSQSHASHHDLSPRIPSHISFSPSGSPFAHPPQFTPCRAERQVSPPLAAEVGPRRRPHVAEACRLVFDVDDDELDFTETPALVRGRTHPERHLQETPKPEQEQEEPPSPRPLISVLNSGSLTSQRFSLPSKIIKNKHPNGQGWIWLAPWSTWSFTVRLRFLMKEKLYPDLEEGSIDVYDGKIYPLHWKPASSDAPDITGLPSMDYAIYLFNAVKFHLGRAYRFFEDASFLSCMNEFYDGEARAVATQHRFWFVQYLLMLAFGKAFLSRSRASKDPLGACYFTRAMSLMPDPAVFRRDSILAIELTALAGLYFYAIDHRESAHVYVGLPRGQFSTSLGLPMSIQDSGITTHLSVPGENSQEDTAVVLQVKLSQLLSHILSCTLLLVLVESDPGVAEVFLVFDLEFVYSAAIHLTMADALFPSVAEDARGHSQAAHSIMDDMMAKGNKVAATRKGDLTQLEDLCRELAARTDARGLQTLTLTLPGLDDSIAGSLSATGSTLEAVAGVEEDVGLQRGLGDGAMAEETPMLWASLPVATTNLEFMDTIGISSEEVFSILDEIGNMDDQGVVYHWPDVG